MATGPEHYLAAETHLDAAAGIETDGYEDSASAWHQRQAQVHATLALAAAYACARIPDMNGWDAEAWQATAGTPRMDAAR